MAGQTANLPMLHRFLGFGATGLALVLVFMRARAGMPVDTEALATIAYALAAISTLLIIVSVVFLTPRVPERRAAETVDAFWASPAVAASVTRIWFLTEGAAVLSAVGYYVTGHLAPAAAMIVALVVFWWLNPNMFAKP